MEQKMEKHTLVLSREGEINTVRKAVEEARKISGEVEIVVRSGCYTVSEPLLLDERDSNRSWIAAPGETVVFRGGESIDNWEECSIHGRRAWRAALPPGRAFRGLWADGKRRERASLPKQGFHRITGVCGHTAKTMMDDGPRTVSFAPGDIQNFYNPEDVEILVLEWWNESHLRIESVDLERHTVTFHRPPVRDMRGENSRFARYRVCNVREALLEQGDWYYDRKTGELWYLPYAEESIGKTEIVVSDLPEILMLRGTREHPVRNVRFERISFRHNGWEQKRDMPDSHQAAIHVPGAVRLEYAENCVFYRCEIAHTTSYGLEIGEGCSGSLVAGCRIHDLGAGGIKILHERFPGKREEAERGSLPRMNATVVDCELCDGGHYFPSSCGLLIGNSAGNIIRNNEIHHFTYTGISLGWVWGFQMEESRGGKNRIEYNHIHHINDGILSDNGAIYSLGRQPGSRIVGNRIHDIGCYFYGGSGIYPDQGSSGLLCEKNSVQAVSGKAFNIHFGRFLTTQNNLFAGGESTPLNFGRIDLSFDNDFSRNQVLFSTEEVLEKAIFPITHFIHDNLLLLPAGLTLRWPGGSLSRLQEKSGNWLNTQELSLPPEKLDFLTDPESCRTIGFQPFNLSMAGAHPEALPERFSDFAAPERDNEPWAESEIRDFRLARSGKDWTIRFHFAIRNLESEPVEGKYQLVLWQDGSPERIPIREISFRASPRSEQEFPVEEHLSCEQIAPGTRQCFLKAQGDDRICFSSAEGFLLPPPPRQLPCYGEEDLEKAESLPGLPMRTMEEETYPVLNGKCMRIGGALAIFASICDPKIQINPDCIWEGSVAELFLASEPGGEILQYFLVPPHDGENSDIRAQIPAQLPADVVYRAERTKDGWKFALILPLKDLVSDPETFCMDLITRSTSHIPMYNTVRLPVWGSLEDYANSNYLAVLTTRAIVSQETEKKD